MWSNRTLVDDTFITQVVVPFGYIPARFEISKVFAVTLN